MVPLVLVLVVLWMFFVFAFVRRRYNAVIRKGGDRLEARSDWAIQLYVTGTVVALLFVIALLTDWI